MVLQVWEDRVCVCVFERRPFSPVTLRVVVIVEEYLGTLGTIVETGSLFRISRDWIGGAVPAFDRSMAVSVYSFLSLSS